ncbi:vasoactive intestinal polypeptide receptor 2 isoform 2-T2 [Macrochelys suwanniensis]
MRNLLLLLFAACCSVGPVNGIHPECRFQLEIHEEEIKCVELLNSVKRVAFKGCVGVWDNLTCWRPAEIGETVTVPCPKVFSHFFSNPGNISKNCTSDGWSETFPDFISACGYDDNDDDSKVGCKASLVFFQYCVMANFYWLLVEGLYLHILLVVIFSPNRHFTVYLLIGWGIPTVFIILWTVTRIFLEDTGCWDTNDHSGPWWVIRLPILISIIVNFILFISIIRILLQKLRSPDVGGNDQSQYKRLAKSTLLLIPLFGVHYMVFAVFPIRISSHYQIIFELCLGSFQGLVVAVLYCFLNSEVQGELKRKWRSLCLSQTVGRDYRLHSCSSSRNGSESVSQLHRNSGVQSFMQTETTMIQTM